jgi:hypothetical protein
MRLPVCCVLAMTLASPLAQAQIYKWVDANGVPQYSNSRPAGVANVTRIDSSNSSVSSYTPMPSRSSAPPPPDWILPPGMQAPPGLRPGQVPPGLPPGVILPPGYLPPEALVPIPGAHPGQPSPEQLAMWKSLCERDRHTDCNDSQALIARYMGGMGINRPVIVRAPLPGGRPDPNAPTQRALRENRKTQTISQPQPDQVPASAPNWGRPPAPPR